jgi:UDP-N-acetylmuramoyl-tripeptide--D-alanyl-D-alanine ligase
LGRGGGTLAARLTKVLSLSGGSPIRRWVKQVRYRSKHALRRRIAVLKRNRSQATFIGITGSSAKSTTTALLAHILASSGTVRGQWLVNTEYALIGTFRRLSKADDYVVVEVGVGGRGVMHPLAGLLRPDVAIITMVGIEHYSQFRSRQGVADEKGFLVAGMAPDGLALLNADDEFVMAMASRTKARIVTFGRERNADYRVVSAEMSVPPGLTVKVEWIGGKTVLHTRLIAEHFWLAAVAAFAAATELGVPSDRIVERIASFPGVPERLELYEIDGGPTFILDTAKAPNETLHLAFGALDRIEAPAKRIVLGQISDYPGASRPKYRKAYRAAAAVADQVIFVGENAHRSGASESDRESGRFLAIPDPRQACEHIKATARPGEMILLKGSRNLHLERIAMAWRSDVQCWEIACGKKMHCRACGLFGIPFDEHRSHQAAAKKARRMKWLPWRRGK